jgi:hypothetical protein
VGGAAEGLKLERGVLDAEMPGYTLPQLIQQGRQVMVADAGIIDDDVGGQDRQVSGDRGGVESCALHGRGICAALVSTRLRYTVRARLSSLAVATWVAERVALLSQ